MRDILLQISSKRRLEIVRNNPLFKNASGININKYSIVEYVDGQFKYILKTDIKNIKRDNFNLDIFDSFSELGEILILHLKEKE